LLVVLTRLSRLNADHSAVGVGRQSAFRLIQQDEFVAKRVANARAPADGDVKRTLDALAACTQEERESLVDVGNHNVCLGPDLQMNDQFRVGLRKSEASRFIASPQQAMTELVPIKGNCRVKIGDAEQVIVEFSKQGPLRAHVDESRTELGTAWLSETTARTGANSPTCLAVLPSRRRLLNVDSSDDPVHQHPHVVAIAAAHDGARSETVDDCIIE
jgi:hypothetical protein